MVVMGILLAFYLYINNFLVKPIDEINFLRKKISLIFGRTFAKRFAHCYRSVVSLSVLSVCLSVTLVYCGHTIGSIQDET